MAKTLAPEETDALLDGFANLVSGLVGVEAGKASGAESMVSANSLHSTEARSWATPSERVSIQ